jgi:flagellar hook-associated protein 3 FlgL
MMQISSSQFYGSSLAGMLNQQSTLNTLSNELSTGNVLVNPADAPVAAAQNVTLTTQINQIASYTQNGQIAQQSLQLESSTLQSVNTLIGQVQQLAQQMNNGTVSGLDLQSAATTMQGYMQQLVQYSNTQDGLGNYVFAGSQTQTQPFSLQADGTVTYNGDGNQNQLALGPSLQVPTGNSGASIFMNIPGGNGTFSVGASGSNTGDATAGPGTVNNTALAQQTLLVNGTQYQISFSADPSGTGLDYSVSSGSGAAMTASGQVASGSFSAGMSITLPPGSDPAITVPVQGTPAAGDAFTIAAAQPQSLFATFQSLEQAFTSTQGNSNGSLRAQTIANALQGLSQGQDNVLSVQSSIGASLQQVQAVQSQNSSMTLQLQTQQSNLTNIDYPQVITAYQESLTALQASESAFSQLQGLSLFKYL